MYKRQILVCRGRIRSVSSEVVTFSIYLPPGIPCKKLTDIKEPLTDAKSEATAKANQPWLVLGGDFNRYDMSVLTQMVPELDKCLHKL